MKIKTLNSLKYFLPATVLLVVAFWGLTAFKTNPSEKAGRPVRVVSLCFKDQEFNKIIKLVDQEAAKGTDIIVLPETWRGQQLPETLNGETITTLSKIAKKYHTYILSPIDRTDGKDRYNTAVLIDREGKVVFGYDKVYPYWAEFDLEGWRREPGSKWGNGLRYRLWPDWCQHLF